MRKLASIQKVLAIDSIPNADTIECLTVLGWKVVAKKNEFKVGDLVVYFEVDSILKESLDIEFLRKSNFRIKTVKLRGQISQGLCLPLSILAGESELPHEPHAEGDDVTELLEVVKYEPYIPAQLSGQVKGNFPEFLHRTDEERIQTCPQLLEKHKDKKFYVTEKCDGSSMTVFLKDEVFGVCSRNLELKETEGNSFWKVARELDLEGKLKQLYNEYKEEYSFQGELVGMGVQGNKYKMSDLNFFIFNVFDITNRVYLNSEEMFKICERLGLCTVPKLGTVTLGTFKTVEDLVEFSKGKSLLNKDTHREGIVLRPLVEEYSEDLRSRLSFKCINPDFLLKYNE